MSQMGCGYFCGGKSGKSSICISVSHLHGCYSDVSLGEPIICMSASQIGVAAAFFLQFGWGKV